MKKVQDIRIWFENCIALELPIEEFESIEIENVSVRYEKCNSSCELTEEYFAYGGIKFSLKPDVSKGRFLLMNFEEDPDNPCNHETIIERLTKWKDITSIELCYQDGNKKEIYVPFHPTTSEGVESSLQTAKIDEDGCLVVEIRPDDSDAIEDGDNEGDDE